MEADFVVSFLPPFLLLVTGAIVSVFAGGCFFGAIFAGYTANKIGRKRTIQVGSAIAVIGW